MPSRSIASRRTRAAAAAPWLFRAVIAAMALIAASSASATVTYNGFGLLRPQTPAPGAPLDDDSLSAQIQAGIDWRPSPSFGTHVHLVARNESDGSKRGRVGIVEAFAEWNASLGRDRIRAMGGAFFLPTSRENIDSLWETPYTLSSSALNSWLGEEFRPVGVDLSYKHATRSFGVLTGGATVFTGNDTFGALPVGRGWSFRDHWAVLGEHLPVNPTFFTSISAETDHRLGWAARTKWNSDRGAIQFTRIDNRADALRYGELFNWATRFNIAGGNYTLGDWTAAGEVGWGTTAIQGRNRVSIPIQAAYVLLSRRLFDGRASVRVDQYKVRAAQENAVTAAYLWEPYPRVRTGVEGIIAEGEKRLAVEVRYRF